MRKLPRVVVWVLRALPEQFRERHCEEMRELLFTEATSRPILSRWFVWLRAVVDILWVAAVLRIGRGKYQGDARRPRSLARAPFAVDSVAQDIRHAFRSDALRQDLVYALRSVVRERGASIAIVLTLAVGIGANAVIFGVVDRLLLSGPEHVRDADRVVRLYMTTTSRTFGERTSAITGYVVYTTTRDQVSAFDEVAAYRAPFAQVLRDGEAAVEVQVSVATWDLFPLLGVEPSLGRFFLEEEDRPPEGVAVAVLGHALWWSRYGGDPAVLGQSIELGTGNYTIVGVAPPGFTGPQSGRVDAWIPMSFASHRMGEGWSTTWSSRWLYVVGRLAPGANEDLAGGQSTAIVRQAYDGSSPSMSAGEARISFAPLHHDTSGAEPLEATVARWLLVVSLILLIIACANVASLELARGARREREVTVRLALGIGRGRLVGLLMTRSLLLAAVGGAAGGVLARQGGDVLRRVLAPTVAWAGSPVDARAFAFAFGATLLAGIMTGLFPAVHALRRDLTGSLRSGGRAGGHRLRSLGTLTVAQASAATVLLVGAALFVRSLANVLAVPLGLEPNRVLTISPDRSPAGGFDAFYMEALERLQALPSVEAVALAIGTPFLNSFGVSLSAPGHDSIPSMPGGGPYISAVTSDFHRTLGVSLSRGRAFTSADQADSEPVAIVNETMARSLWAAEDPLTQCLHIGSGDAPCARVVGVVEDTRAGLDAQASMQYYVPLGQERGIGGTNLLVRPRGEAESAIAEISTALQEIAGPSAFLRVSTLQERLDPEIRPWRTGATLSSLLGLLALGVAAFGLFSVIAYVAAQRTHEVGVRMALGARSEQVGRMMLRQGMALVLSGLAIGIFAVVALGRFLEPALFQVSPHDPVILGGVALAVAAVGVVAALVPALRAARVDPVIALRTD